MVGGVLSENGVTALRYIHAYRSLTKDHVATVTEMQPKSASELLLRLERQKLLAHYGNVPIMGRGKTPKVYYLTKRGYGVLADEVDAHEDLSSFKAVNAKNKWSPKMAHKIATLNVLMAIELAVRKRPEYRLVQTLFEYRREFVAGRWLAETADYVATPARSENKLVPDAGFILENCETGRRALFLIEVDLGTESHTTTSDDRISQTVRHKIKQYDRYIQSGRFRLRYRAKGEFRHFVALIITNSEQRLHNMRKAVSDLPHQLHQYYRFSTLDAVYANFFHHYWRGRSERDQQAYALIREG